MVFQVAACPWPAALRVLSGMRADPSVEPGAVAHNAAIAAAARAERADVALAVLAVAQAPQLSTEATKQSHR